MRLAEILLAIALGPGVAGAGEIPAAKDQVLVATQHVEPARYEWTLAPKVGTIRATEERDLAFVVTDPSLWVKDYVVTIRREQMEELGLARLEDGHVFVIVNKYDQTLTANAQGPLVINVHNRSGMQLVLADKRWTTRHESAQMGEPVHAVSA